MEKVPRTVITVRNTAFSETLQGSRRIAILQPEISLSSPKNYFLSLGSLVLARTGRSRKKWSVLPLCNFDNVNFSVRWVWRHGFLNVIASAVTAFQIRYWRILSRKLAAHSRPCLKSHSNFFAWRLRGSKSAWCRTFLVHGPHVLGLASKCSWIRNEDGLPTYLCSSDQVLVAGCELQHVEFWECIKGSVNNWE